jgi:hypothetical protein
MGWPRATFFSPVQKKKLARNWIGKVVERHRRLETFRPSIHIEHKSYKMKKDILYEEEKEKEVDGDEKKYEKSRRET